MRAFIILSLATLLAGCGFQLRGQQALPESMERTFVTAPVPDGELVDELQRLLRAHGVTLAEERSDATATLQITHDRMNRVVQSVGAGARVREFAMEYHVGFTLLDASGEVVIAQQNLEMVRDYTFDQQQVLGTTSEEEILRQDLRRAMAAQIVSNLTPR